MTNKNLSQIFKEISLLGILEGNKENYDEWQIDLIKQMWDLYNNKIFSKKWTDENITQIIKKTTLKFKDELEEEISRMVENNDE